MSEEVYKDTCVVCRTDIDRQLKEVKDDAKEDSTRIDTIEKAVVLLTQYVQDEKARKKEGKGWLYTVSGALVVNVVMMVIMLLSGKVG